MTDFSELDKNEIMQAIVEGVRQGIMSMALNGTDCPGADLFDAIQKGVADGMFRLGPFDGGEQ
jgi:hypothetical protein